MATSNLSIVLAAQMITTNVQLSPSPQVATWLLNNPTLAATAQFSQFYPQISTTTTIPLPSPTVALVGVQHLGTSGDLVVHFTPTSGSPETLTLSPGPTSGVGGGIFIYMCPNIDAASGIIALSLSPSTGTIPAFVIVAY